MRRILTILAATLSTAIQPGTAHAHLGHLGDLAGHSHWIGIALGLAGAAGAAAIALLPKDEAESDMQEASESEEPTDEVEGEGQPA
ncbi:MAG: DUF6732 family protein [Nitratireductor sp.]